ncbi:MAG: hypothetical protein LBF18_24200 [Pantoea sp.]|nr:hypothetical protein [Pantoea sp.]
MGEVLVGKDEGEPATAVVAPAVVAPLVGAIFFRRAVRRPVIECTKRETVARSSSDSAAEAEEPACIVSSSKAYSNHKAVSYAVSQSVGFSPRSSLTAAARDWGNIKVSAGGK